MPHLPHQTTPFRRPSGSWPQETRPDPAEVGTAFGLELSLEGEASKAGRDGGPGTRPDNPETPPLCP